VDRSQAKQAGPMALRFDGVPLRKGHGDGFTPCGTSRAWQRSVQ
jgi:hypothetical protein